MPRPSTEEILRENMDLAEKLRPLIDEARTTIETLGPEGDREPVIENFLNTVQDTLGISDQNAIVTAMRIANSDKPELDAEVIAQIG